jgi:hypothetical protein
MSSLVDCDDDNPSVDTDALLKERGGEDIYNNYNEDNPLGGRLGILLEDTNSITGNVFDGWEAPAWRSRSTNRS